DRTIFVEIAVPLHRLDERLGGEARDNLVVVGGLEDASCAEVSGDAAEAEIEALRAVEDAGRVVLAVAVGVVIREGASDLGELLGRVRHLEVESIEPVLADHDAVARL